MLDLWVQDIESLEAISQDDDTRRIFLKMAALSRSGGMDTFLAHLASDEDVDDETKSTLAELGRDQAFLFALEDYLRLTNRLH